MTATVPSGSTPPVGLALARDDEVAAVVAERERVRQRPDGDRADEASGRDVVEADLAGVGDDGRLHGDGDEAVLEHDDAVGRARRDADRQHEGRVGRVREVDGLDLARLRVDEERAARRHVVVDDLGCGLVVEARRVRAGGRERDRRLGGGEGWKGEPEEQEQSAHEHGVRRGVP